MGLFGGGKGRGLLGSFDPSGFAVAQAFLNGDYGSAAQIIAQQRRLAAEQRQAEEEAEARRQAGSSRARMLGALGYGKDEIAAMRPEEASRLVMERLRTRPVGAEAGAAHNAAPAARPPSWPALHSHPPQAPSPPPAGPPPGTVAGGCRFRGGDPNDRRNWDPIGSLGPSGLGGFPGFPF